MTYFDSIYDNSKMSYVYIETRDMNKKLNNLNFKDMIEKFILKSNTVEMLYENRSWNQQNCSII